MILMPRCPDCDHILTGETMRLRGRLGFTGWLWCMWCGARKEPVWV